MRALLERRSELPWRTMRKFGTGQRLRNALVYIRCLISFLTWACRGGLNFFGNPDFAMIFSFLRSSYLTSHGNLNLSKFALHSFPVSHMRTGIRKASTPVLTSGIRTRSSLRMQTYFRWSFFSAAKRFL